MSLTHYGIVLFSFSLLARSLRIFACLRISFYFFSFVTRSVCHHVVSVTLCHRLLFSDFPLDVGVKYKMQQNKLEYTISLNRVHTQPGQPGVKHTQIPQYQDQKCANFSNIRPKIRNFYRFMQHALTMISLDIWYMQLIFLTPKTGCIDRTTYKLFRAPF